MIKCIVLHHVNTLSFPSYLSSLAFDFVAMSSYDPLSSLHTCYSHHHFPPTSLYTEHNKHRSSHTNCYVYMSSVTFPYSLPHSHLCPLHGTLGPSVQTCCRPTVTLARPSFSRALP